MKITVTGGTSFVGANPVHALPEDHPDVGVVALDKLTYAGDRALLTDVPAELAARLTAVEGGVADTNLVDGVVAGADAIARFAAESRNDDPFLDPSPFIQTNLMGTFVLLEVVRRHKIRFHHISANRVYGDLGLGNLAKSTPTTPYNPSSLHSLSKAGPNLLVCVQAHSFGVEAIISSCSNNHGSYQYIEEFIPRTITNRLRGMHPRLYGDGLNVRGWIHVRDHNATVWDILIKGHTDETYLIGVDDETNSRDVTAILSELMDYTPDDFDHATDCPGHNLHHATDNFRPVTELGWEPQFTNFRDGLADMTAWYTKNGTWWAPLKEAAETEYVVEGH